VGLAALLVVGVEKRFLARRRGIASRKNGAPWRHGITRFRESDLAHKGIHLRRASGRATKD